MKYAVVILLCGLVYVASVATSLTLNQSRKHMIVSADIAALTRDFTLELAQTDKSPTEMTEAVDIWSTGLLRQLQQTAEQHRLIILPADLGAVGIDDVTEVFTQKDDE